MKFTRNPLTNQRIIMDLAAKALEEILASEPKLGKAYIWRLQNAIRLLRNPPIKNKGMRG